MFKSQFETETSGFLAKAENLTTAGEIFNEISLTTASILDDPNPVAAFLSLPANVDLARIIRDEFPGSLRSLAKIPLFKTIYAECRKEFASSRKWEVVVYPEDDEALLGERWPEINLQPRRASDVYWGFCLSMDTKKIPIPISHGVVSSEPGGRPKTMRKDLLLAVSQIEREFKKLRFNVTQNPKNGWFARSSIPYKEYAIGANPALLAGIYTGDFARAVTKEFLQLFTLWVAKIEQLNKLL